jgi:Glycine rich protein
MNVIDFGRRATAVASSGMLALLLSDCAMQSSRVAPPGQSGAATEPAGEQILKFTGKKQTFTVPSGVTTITIAAYGASGGGIGSYLGGRGGLVKAKIPVTQGESLSVFVGEGALMNGRSAFNGGGAGYGDRHHRSGGGGGASDVRLDTGVRILVAGGGGGAGGVSGENFHRDAALRSALSGYGRGGDGGGNVADAGGGAAYGAYQVAGGGLYGGSGASGSSSCTAGAGASGVRHIGGAGGSACYAGGGGGSSFIEKSATTIQNVKGGLRRETAALRYRGSARRQPR